MKRTIILVLGTLSFLLGGCVCPTGRTAQSLQQPRALVGYWYCSDKEQMPGLELQILSAHQPDGTYLLTFAKVSKSGELLDSWEEAGRWCYSYGMMATMTFRRNQDMTDISDRYYNDLYLFDLITPREIIYRSPALELRWHATRVGKDFVLPALQKWPNKPLQGTEGKAPSSSTEPETLRP